MRYISWAVFYEGPSDHLYMNVLLHRFMEELIATEGIRHSDVPEVPAASLGADGRAVASVAAEICKLKDALAVVFIHADTGGRGLERGLNARSSAYCEKAFEKCGWPCVRCVTLLPRHETEAWILADPLAITNALGYTGPPGDLELPSGARDAERLHDPKAVLATAISKASGDRRRNPKPQNLFAAIAQRQSFDELRRSDSFKEFEQRLRQCLGDIGCIPRIP